MPTTPKDARQRELGAIHIAAKQLGMDDDVYRAMLRQVAGVDSAGDLDATGRRAVLDHLRRIGAAPRGNQWRGRPKGDLSPQLKKIEALLADNGRPWGYAHAVARRICKVERVEWCDMAQLGKVIAALQIDANRRKR